MRGRFMRHLLTSLHLRRKGSFTPLPPATTPISPYPNRPFCSQAADSSDPFASLKCYTRRDPHTPYYVVEHPSPPAFEKAENAVPDDAFLSRWNIQHLTCTSKGPEEGDGESTTSHVYLVGVGSDENSVEQIKDIMGYLKPEVLFLELCASRRLYLAFEKIKGNKWVQVQHRVSRVAFEEALCNGAKVILGDRPFHVTVRRILEGMLAMRILDFTKLSVFLFFQFMDYGKDNKTFNINDFIHQKLKELMAFPALLYPAIHERDLYMSSVLNTVAKDNKSVVAVIGIDHVSGIMKNWEHVTQDKKHAIENSE